MSSFLPADAVDVSANDNVGPRLLPMLISLSKSSNALLGLRLAAIGLKIGQDEALLEVQRSTAATAATVATGLCIRPSTAAMLLAQLVEKGLIAGKGAGSGYGVTPAGLAAQEMVHAVYQKLEQDLLPSGSDAAGLLGELKELQQGLMRQLATMI